MAGGLGLQWMLGPGGVLAGGTPLNISLGASFDKIGVVFANISIRGGAGVTLEGLGYLTIAGGGAYVTGSTLNNWLNGGDRKPLSPEQRVDQAIVNAKTNLEKASQVESQRYMITPNGTRLDIVDYTGPKYIGGEAPISGMGGGLNGNLIKQLEKQLAKDGVKSIFKSYESLKIRPLEHGKKLPDLLNKSSVEREIRTWERDIRTIEEFLKNLGLF